MMIVTDMDMVKIQNLEVQVRMNFWNIRIIWLEVLLRSWIRPYLDLMVILTEPAKNCVQLIGR